MTTNNLTVERLRELLHYEHETGVFTCLMRRGNSLIGGISGTLHHDGYWQIKAFDSPKKAHDAYLAAKRILHAGCTI